MLEKLTRYYKRITTIIPFSGNHHAISTTDIRFFADKGGSCAPSVFH